MQKAGGALGALFLAVVLTGCAASGQPKPATDNVVMPGHVRPEPGALIVVLPPNEASVAAKGDRLLVQQIALQLKASGYRVGTVDDATLKELWQVHGESVGGLYDPISGAAKPKARAEAHGAVIRNICADAGCALVLQPRVVVRKARLKGTVAEWDGVRMPIPMTTGSDTTRRFDGDSHAYSAQVIAYAPNGDCAFGMHAGISLVHAINTRRATTELVSDPFEEPSRMSKAAALALGPITSR
jgi:hypothetical protein